MVNKKQIILCNILFFSIWIIGLTYLCTGIICYNSYTGILDRGSVYIDNNCNTHCGSEKSNCYAIYYIDQIFRKVKQVLILALSED